MPTAKHSKARDARSASDSAAARALAQPFPSQRRPHPVLFVEHS